MHLYNIINLEIRSVTKDVLLIHQKETPYYFSCCDGLIILPKKHRNEQSIVLDLNIEPRLIDKIESYYGPFSNYVCTHGHMDHMAHVHHWESLGVKIHAPIPENTYLLDLYNFYTGFGFNEQLDYNFIEKFAKNNKYQPCKYLKAFKPGDTLKFEQFYVETILFKGHSRGHIGFFLPSEKLLHISCLGFDQPKPGLDGFGPWYGFNECSITQYQEDIDLAEEIFLKRAKYLTSSHSYIVENPDITPFSYMRRKIAEKQVIIDQAIKSHKLRYEGENNIDYLLDLDLFFPKKKLKGYIVELYKYWEQNIINKHLQKSNYSLNDYKSKSS